MGVDEEIYVVLVHAMALVGNDKIVGDRHALLVFVSEDSIEEAKIVASKVLEDCFWGEIEIKKASIVDPKLGVSKDMEDAMSDAAVYGSAIIVYSDPIPKN